MAPVRWKDKTDIGTLADGDRMPVTDVDDANTDKYTTPAEFVSYLATKVVSVLRLGVGGATPDTTNVISANVPAVLLNRATDDIQVKLNKEAAGDTASFLFQTNFNGFAEIGLTGDDDFHFKVSPDNFSTTFEAIIIDKDDGSSTVLPGLTVNPGSDTDANLLVVNVTGAPTFSWDESEDAFVLNKPLSLGASNVFTCGSINIGHASDTTLSRAAAGVLAVEGNDLAKTEPGVNPQTGTSYTLALTDKGGVVTMSNGSANTLTIPTNASVAFPTHTIINVIMLGAGTTSITGDTGVTVNGVSAGSGDIQTQYQGVSLLKIATNTWVASGDIGTVA